MQLHLVVPGLLWPTSLLRDNTRDLELPALAHLLGRAQLTWLPANSPEAALCQVFGLQTEAGTTATPEAHPLAALRQLGQAHDTTDQTSVRQARDFWLCADPVHLSLQRTRLMLDRSAQPASESELQLIAESINALLAEQDDTDFLGHARFIAGSHGQGYLTLPASAPPTARSVWQRLHTITPSMAASHDDMLPQGDSAEARRWRHFINQAQMCLHQLPLNQVRAANAQPPLNALWLWGGGHLPWPSAEALRPPLRVIGQTTQADNQHVLAGLAQLHGQPVETIRSVAQLLPLKHDCIWLIDCLQAPWQEWNALDWRQQLLELEQHWLQPLLAAWNNRRIDRLTLLAPGRSASLQLELRPRDRLRFWRRPHPLASLDIPHESASTAS